MAGLSFSGDGSQTSSNEGRMDVLNLLTGQEEWSITLNEAEELRGSPVVDGGWIYGGRRDWEGREGLHRAVAWSLEDGHEGWSTALDPAAGPTRVGELLLVPELGTAPGLSLLSATCGVIMARHDQTGSYPLPPLVDGDTVYVYDATGGTLGALALPSALPDPADMDGDGAPASADCNDCDPQVLPGAADRVGDDQDNNCDGVDGTDEDADGYAGAGSGGTDCDDGDASVYPGALEVWYDGLDQDCGEDSDFDADQDGHESADYGGVDCDDADASVHPGAPEVWYDGVDQNCNGSSDYDADFDGYDATSGGGTDCDDTDAVVNPGVVERCNTSVDDNCDGDTNDNGAYQCDAYALDADGDGYGDPALGDCFCTLPTGYSDNTDDCDDAD
ncbi:MAG TPA: putative metal-binding motif-containing protein, partial [Myxococcota bacterium]|nr:putative metal-binding motif-containing protein [Myxococcota bacterium]